LQFWYALRSAQRRVVLKPRPAPSLDVGGFGARDIERATFSKVLDAIILSRVLIGDDAMIRAVGDLRRAYRSGRLRKSCAGAALTFQRGLPPRRKVRSHGAI